MRSKIFRIYRNISSTSPGGWSESHVVLHGVRYPGSFWLVALPCVDLISCAKWGHPYSRQQNGGRDREKEAKGMCELVRA